MRHDVMAKVCGIIPDIEPIADFTPADDVIAERLIPLVRQRFAERALDTTQSYDYILPWFDVFGGLAGILVGQRTDRDVGEFLLDRFGHRIDEM